MLLSNILIVIWSWIYIVKKLNMTLGKINFKDVKAQIKHSSIFFASRIATTAYGASNVLVLGIYGFSNTALGIYGAADNLITYGKAVFSPIADSLYPYMIKNKKYRLVKYILLLMVPLISAACIVMYFMADFIIELMCGKEYMEAVPIFRLMIPLLIIALPTYLFGYPMLGAINQNNKANSTVIVGAIFHIIGLMILYVGQILTFNNVIYLTITTEVIILILRIYYFNKYKNRGRGLLKEDSR